MSFPCVTALWALLLHRRTLLPRLDVRAFPSPVSSHCFPSRQDGEVPCAAAVRLSVSPVFPSPCGQRPGTCHRRLRYDSRRGLPRQQHRLPHRHCQPLAKRGSRGSRTRGFPGTPGRAAGSRPACPALRRQGRSVARAAGPRHHRPWLRHEAHRRGAASAAFRPPQARARAVATVGLSAQPPADRSVQPLIPHCRWTAPASCWAARRYSGPPLAR